MPLSEHPLLLSVPLLLLFVITEELGYRLACSRGVTEDEARREQITASRDALGVLLSLLLGFTLAMALSRYDLHRHLILDEANAISSAGLRSDMLPVPYRENTRALLLDYARTRLAYSLAGTASLQFQQAQNTTQNLQSQLWSQAQAVARANPTAITSLFVQSLNEVFDLSEKRQAALENPIPRTVWLMLVIIAILTCLMFGYATRSRSWLVLLIAPVMTATVMGLIADLDAPRRGLLRADLRSLERVEHDLQLPAVMAPDSHDPR